MLYDGSKRGKYLRLKKKYILVNGSAYEESSDESKNHCMGLHVRRVRRSKT